MKYIVFANIKKYILKNYLSELCVYNLNEFFCRYNFLVLSSVAEIMYSGRVCKYHAPVKLKLKMNRILNE